MGLVGTAPPSKDPARAPYRILVVDHDARSREATTTLLRREGHDVHSAGAGAEALALLGRRAVHAMVVRDVLPDMTGPELVEQVRRTNDLVQIVLHASQSYTCPPRELLRTLSIQGYHDASDDAHKLLESVDLACRTFVVLERTRRSEHVKTQLVANVSHELRTPLNVILGYVELMREGACGPQTAEGAEALVTIHRQALILLHLINDLLDMSKLQAGAMQLARERVCLSSIVEEFRDALPILIGAGEVAPRWEVEPGVHAMADAGKVRVIVQNLVSNAAKFTARGEIVIGVWAAGGRALVAVRDTGPGIRPEDRERIFELFEQADPVDGRRHAGTGIGLHLARALARLMGGELTVDSTLGCGSTFTLDLPLAS
jgi:signal transduction histidine kinase